MLLNYHFASSFLANREEYFTYFIPPEIAFDVRQDERKIYINLS